MDISSNIKRLIKERGLNISRLAEEMTRISKEKTPEGEKAKTYSQSGLSQIIAGNPTLSTLCLLADALQCDVSELIGERNYLVCPKCGAHFKVDITCCD